jgi:hypothetical protein
MKQQGRPRHRSAASCCIVLHRAAADGLRCLIAYAEGACAATEIKHAAWDCFQLRLVLFDYRLMRRNSAGGTSAEHTE